MVGQMMPLCNKMFCCIFGWCFYIEIRLKREKIVCCPFLSFFYCLPFSMENSAVCQLFNLDRPHEPIGLNIHYFLNHFIELCPNNCYRVLKFIRSDVNWSISSLFIDKEAKKLVTAYAWVAASVVHRQNWWSEVFYWLLSVQLRIKLDLEIIRGKSR